MEDWEQWGEEEINNADIKQAEVANDDDEKKVLEDIAKKEAEKESQAKKDQTAKEEVKQTKVKKGKNYE